MLTFFVFKQFIRCIIYVQSKSHNARTIMLTLSQELCWHCVDGWGNVGACQIVTSYVVIMVCSVMEPWSCHWRQEVTFVPSNYHYFRLVKRQYLKQCQWRWQIHSKFGCVFMTHFLTFTAAIDKWRQLSGLQHNNKCDAWLIIITAWFQLINMSRMQKFINNTW